MKSPGTGRVTTSLVVVVDWVLELLWRGGEVVSKLASLKLKALIFNGAKQLAATAADSHIELATRPRQTAQALYPASYNARGWSENAVQANAQPTGPFVSSTLRQRGVRLPRASCHDARQHRYQVPFGLAPKPGRGRDITRQRFSPPGLAWGRDQA